MKGLPIRRGEFEVERKSIRFLNHVKSPYTDKLRLRFLKHDGTSSSKDHNGSYLEQQTESRSTGREGEN